MDWQGLFERGKYELPEQLTFWEQFGGQITMYGKFIWRVIEDLAKGNVMFANIITMVTYDFCRDKKCFKYLIVSFLILILAYSIGVYI